MLFGMFFAFWRFCEIITLVCDYSLFPLSSHLINNFSSSLDPNIRNARILRQHLRIQQCAHSKLHPSAVHRLSARLRLGHRNPLHLPPRPLQRALRLLHRSLFRGGIHRRRLRTPLHHQLRLLAPDHYSRLLHQLRSIWKREYQRCECQS